MGDLGCKPAHGCKFFGLKKLLPCPAEFSLHFQPFGKIHEITHGCDFVPFIIVKNAGGQVSFHRFPVPVVKRDRVGFQFSRSPVISTPHHLHDFPCQTFRIEALDVHLADDLIRLIIENFLRTLVPDNDIPFKIGGHDGIGRTENRFVQKVIRLFHLVLHLFSVGLVHHYPFITKHPPLGIAPGMPGQKNLNDAAVFPLPFHLIVQNLSLLFYNLHVPVPVFGFQVKLRGQIQRKKLLLVVVPEHFQKRRVHIQKTPLPGALKHSASYIFKKTAKVLF